MTGDHDGRVPAPRRINAHAAGEQPPRRHRPLLNLLKLLALGVAAAAAIAGAGIVIAWWAHVR